MNYSIYRISLDIHKSESQTTLLVKKADTSRRLIVTLTENGKPYAISDDCRAFFIDSNKTFTESSIEGNTIIYDLTTQTTGEVGMKHCEIRLIGVDDKVITSPSFTVTVEDTVYTEGIEETVPENEVTVLTGLISDAEEAISEANSLVANVENKLANGEFKGEKGDRGDKGEKGDKGEDGINGANGTTPNVTATARVEIEEEDYPAFVMVDKMGDAENPWFEFFFQLPRGKKGDKGEKGEKGEKGDTPTKQTWTVTVDEDVSEFSITHDNSFNAINHNGDVFVLVECPAVEAIGRAYVGVNNGENGSNHWVGIANNFCYTSVIYHELHFHKIGDYVSTTIYTNNTNENTVGQISIGTTTYQTDSIKKITFKMASNTSYPATVIPAGTKITIELR